MKSGTERVEPQLPCPQCRELMPADSPYCSACGAELYAQCPDCGTRRNAEDAFCRKCGFNFSRKKLRLKDPAPIARSEASERAATGPGNHLPRVQFQKSKKRAEYRMSPLQGNVRAFLMLVFLVLMAAAVSWGAYWIWENVSGQDLLEKFKQGPSAVFKWTAAKPAVEPDWNARSNYWAGYYRDIFAPPPAKARVAVDLLNGNRVQGVLIQITADQVLLQKDGHELGFPRVVMDDATRRIFFPDDYASAGAHVKVAVEKAAWRKQAAQQNAVPAGKPGSQPPPPPALLPPAPPPTRTFLEIKCPACKGVGFFMVSSSLAREVDKKNKAPCPVCGGKGSRRFDKAPDFPWPAGASRCGKCQGMGMVWSKESSFVAKGVIRATVCPMCHHRGYVVNKWDAAHDVPPRYE